MGVTIRLVGALRVERGDRDETLRLGSPKERRLLALLAARRPAVLAPEVLAAALWEDGAPARPAAGVATLVSRLRARIAPDVVLGDREGYRLGTPPAVRVDLDDAADLLAEADRRLTAGAPGLGASAATRAAELLSAGEPLPGEPDAAWVSAARDEWRALLRTARHRGAEASLRTGDADVARRLATAAVDADRFDEAAHRLLLRSHQLAGEPSRAVEAYRRLRTDLVDELGVEPSARTRESYVAVLREEDPVVPAPTTSPTARPPLAGRSIETERLAQRWEQACQGTPGVVLLAGEAGIGKTCLAREVTDLAAATGARVAWGRCYAAERSLFLQPVVDALGDVLAALPSPVVRTCLGTWGAVLAGLFPDLVDALDAPTGTDRRPDARTVFAALAGVLGALTATRPLLLVLDDLHTAGLATVELLHYLALRSAGARLMVLATVRAEEGDDVLVPLAEVADRIDLGPLDAAAVDELATRAGQSALGEVIRRRTRGHPLFVVETLRGLVAGRDGVPESLQAAVVARVRGRGPEVEEVLRAGAVLGATVDPEVLGGLLAVSGAEAGRRCARAADARLLVVADRSYEFANDLVHEVLYATTPVPIRRLYHRRAADLLAATPEAVGAHAAAVEDWPRAARAYLLAGEHAAAQGAVGDAESLHGRALEADAHVEDPEIRGRVLLARARAREGLEHYDDAFSDLGAALAAAREAGDRRLEMAALRELGGDVPIARGVPATECAAAVDAGLRIAESLGDRRAQAGARARLAVLAANRLAFTEAVDQGGRAVAVARDAGDDQALVLGLDGLKTAYAYLGLIRELTAVVDEMEPLARRLGTRGLLQWTVFESSFAAIAAGRWDEARARIDEAVAVNRRAGYGGHDTWFVAHRGWVARLAGDLDEALVLGRRAVARTGPVGHRWWRPTALALLAGTHLARGEVDPARAVAREGLTHTGPDGVAACRLRCLAPLAEAGGPEGRDALVEADRLLASIAAPPGTAWLLGVDAYLSVARAWRDRGDRVRAEEVLRAPDAAAARHGWRSLRPVLRGALPTPAPTGSR